MVAATRNSELGEINFHCKMKSNPGSIKANKERGRMSDIKYEIIKKIGVLSATASGWEKQLNLISWNDREPKYDIREW